MSATQLRLFKHLIMELLAYRAEGRVPEPDLVMDDPHQAEAFMLAGRENGVVAPTYLFHSLQISRLISHGDQVLDLACGPANQLAQIARIHPDANFIGLDASPEMLKRANSNVSRFGLRNVQFRTGHIQDLGEFPDNSTDLVISTMSLHHLPDLKALGRTFREAARVLRPDGGLYLADFSRLKREATRRFFAEKDQDQQPDEFTKDYLNSLLAAFTSRELRDAMGVFGLGTRFNATAFVPFMVVIHKGVQYPILPSVRSECRAIYKRLNSRQKTDFRRLKSFFLLGGLSTPHF
ncbi:hypothetical protein CKO40_22280 [Halochromatium glycolicum]|uniref:Methyltransferase domain-containing protein n=2 Tax=Halochromatium glycolicum TaxID=85075 RepID=A0AAJ0U8B8_9GAMM|nr:hypothetical protein [Halochromatium glycolicum]